LKDAIETALGVHFQGEEGDHFFKSTLVQTLFYGIFSGWVIWARQGNRPPFDWRTAAWVLSVPMIRTLFSEIVNPMRLRPLGLTEVLDNTARALDRVDREAFFATFDTGAAVQHFYEPFLQAFDPELRKSLGVWYTPPEIVRYMVERVDCTLRTTLGVADGLADNNVFVLDPCCGTGAYVVEVLRRIRKTLQDRGEDALIGEDLKAAAQNRVFGFELLSAPFIIAHWQVGNLLAEVDAPLDAAAGERPAIYLTNALTGWVPPQGPRAQLPLFPELAQERDAAERVKQQVPILVVIGNPPYNAFAGTTPDEEEGLVEAYKEGLFSVWHVRKYNLDDLYVRFLRIGERRITATGRGIVCYISNYSYIDDPSFVVARQRLMGEFDSIWIDCLNGDSRETGKLTPDGHPDPSIFSTPFNREGIRLGTAIGLFARTQQRSGERARHVRYRDFWGARKREELLQSLDIPNFEDPYATATPVAENRFSFRPTHASAAYRSWPKVTELCAEDPISGLQEMRRGRLIAIDRAELEARMAEYFNPEFEWQEIVARRAGPVDAAGRFDPMRAQRHASSLHA
jgi:predicted helicase